MISEEFIGERYKPVIDPLKEIAMNVTKLPDQQNLLKMEDKKPIIDQDEQNRELYFDRLEQNKNQDEREHDEQAVSADIQDDDDEQEADIHGDDEKADDRVAVMLNESNINTFLQQFDSLPRKYVEFMIKDTKKSIDTTFGMHYDIESNSLKIGDSLIKFQGPNLVIKNKTYRGTSGLYQLLVMNTPDPNTIAQSDEKNYREILDKTFANRRGHTVDDEVTKEYNNTKHHTTGMRPVAVSPQTKLKVYEHIKIFGKQHLKIGDVVRISKFKNIFEKGYTPNWSTELFKIINIRVSNPVHYLLEDMHGKPIAGGFYEYELQKTKNHDVYLIEKVLKKRGNEIYVTWLGLDKSHNQWINKNNVM
ncbi:uncharacterized protein LOC116165394 [Photinus pyralis]|uniref:uncharacterized protein LOC116165394 n=1 Tax=Photinus pyralis TaxID=7054 RepID=UPI0012674908|nr:uncharacterized protein LOC116165394 [Photinus pyralis]